MKKLIILFLFIGCFFGSCKEKYPDSNKSTIAGKIDGIESGNVRIIRLLDLEEMANESIDSVGNFNISIDISESGYYFTLFPGDQTIIFLRPADSIYITFDITDKKGTFYTSGDMARETLYLMEAREDSKKSEFSFPNIVKIAEDKDIYFGKLNEEIKALETRYDSLKLIEGIDKEFLATQKAQIEYQELNNERMFPLIHRRSLGLKSTDEIDFDEDKLWEKIAAVDFDNPVLLKTIGGIDLLSSYLDKLVSEIISREQLEAVPENISLEYYFDLSDSIVSNDRIRNHVKYSKLKMNMRFMSPFRVVGLYERFLSENTYQPYSEALTSIFEKWEGIAPGKEVPDFSFTDINGKDVLLSDLEGKIIYIDIWATWCGPCLAEQPHWSTLIDEFEGTDVVFLTISIDNTREAWEKFLTGKNMAGHNWFAENAFQSEIARHFSIEGIPRFLLLDRERRIIDPSAERPSGNIRKILMEHI
jgi:thiol-disulfide isomerase/thioredoxin